MRPGAHQFWLLQYSTHPDGYLERPWIIWLQGGPGVPGSGIGNYMLIGPEDSDFQPRATSWLSYVSILYVDYPIPTGFSYLDNDTEYSFAYEDTSADLVVFIQRFLERNPEFVDLPLYIFGESYGGKLGPALAYYLEQSRQQGEIECKLIAVCIGEYSRKCSIIFKTITLITLLLLSSRCCCCCCSCCCCCCCY